MRELGRWGLEFVEFDQTGPPPPADVVWLESPANPVLTMPDWDAVRAHRDEHGSLVVCDATVSTPVFLRALDEGADVVVHSATKFLTGSHDALLGATVTRDPEQTARLRSLRTNFGNVSSPHSAAAAAARARLAGAAHAARSRPPRRRSRGASTSTRRSSSSATPASRA